MMARYAYENAKFDATYHIQIEIMHERSEEEEVRRKGQATDTFPVRGVVKRIFLGNELLEVEDVVLFTIAIAPDGADIPSGPYSYQRLDQYVSSPCLEVFLNGRPPDLEVAASQCRVIGNISQTPAIPVPEGRVPSIPEDDRKQILESSSRAGLAIERMLDNADSNDIGAFKWDRNTSTWIRRAVVAPTDKKSMSKSWWAFWK